MHTQEVCLCGSGLHRDACCARYHGGILAPSPEALMRARYTAYAQNRTDYLRASWHPDTCPTDLKPDEVTQWRRLEIRSTGCEADEGWVHFCATWQAADQWGELEERSRFVRQQGRWLYHSGDVVQRGLKPGRNDPCPCGSGRKLKKCCAA